MAQSTGGGQVRAGECPTGRCVVECAVRPQDGVMARGAQRSRVLQRYVIGDCTSKGLRAVPIRRVAAGGIAISIIQAVVVPDVALVAIRRGASRGHLVIARQSPACGGVGP